MKKAPFSFILIAGFACGVGTAAAGPDEATALGRQGLKEINDGHFDAARQLFARSYALVPNAKILLNWAIAELNAGAAIDAANHFRAYVNAPDAVADRIQLVRKELLPQAYEKIVRVVAEIPEGSQVEIDGRTVTTRAGDDNSIVTLPGEHVMRLPDGRETRFAGEPGQLVRVSFVEKGRVGPLLLRQDAAPHAPETLTADTPRSPSLSSARTWTLVTGAALTAVAAGTGAVFGLNAHAEDSDAARQLEGLVRKLGANPCRDPSPTDAGACADLKATVERRARNANAANVAFVGAGVLAIATAATFVLWKPSGAQSSTATVVPSLGPGAFHLTVTTPF